MTPTLQRVPVERVLSAEAATKMVGERISAGTEFVPSAITPGTVLFDADTGSPLLAYTKLVDPGPLRRAMLEIAPTCDRGVARSKHYRSRSRTFGYAPRRPVMGRESCQLTSIYAEAPHIAHVLEGYADQFSDWIAAVDPEIVEANQRTLTDVLPEWRMGDAKLWTSGVINDTAQLPYHRDGFNFPTWSAMPVVRRGTRGGHLHLPEYDLVVPCADATVTYFEGHRYVHGVTPIQRVKSLSAGATKPQDSYRISVVYYALRGMANCREYAEEMATGKKQRTAREADMATRLKAGDRTIPNKGVGALDRMHGTLASGGFTSDQEVKR